MSDADVPDQDGSLDEDKQKGFMKMMKAILDYGITASGETVSGVDSVRFEAWLTGRYFGTSTPKHGPVLDEKLRQEIHQSNLGVS